MKKIQRELYLVVRSLKVSAHLDARAPRAKDRIRNLGITIDSGLNFSSRVKAISKAVFYHLKNISRFKNLMSQQDL